MSKKDYETISTCFRVANELYELDIHTLEHMVETLALEFELDNPRFDKRKFIKACAV